MTSNLKKHQEMLNEFIDLANKFKDQGNQPHIVSAALMSATAFYTTYVYAGNEGYLQDSGVTKVVNAFEKDLRKVQAFKQAQVQQAKATATEQ